MIRRHIDVIAVFVITLGLLALSQAAPFRMMPAPSFHFENVRLNAPQCPLDSLFNH